MIVHKLVGYDKKTERVSKEIPLNDADLRGIVEHFRVPSSYFEKFGAFELNGPFMHVLSSPGNSGPEGDLDWFLEPFEAVQHAHAAV
jgi:hypothetical protein